TSQCRTPLSSASSRAGRATCARRTTTRSSVVIFRASPRTHRSSPWPKPRRRCAARTRTSGSTPARPIRSTGRTARSRASLRGSAAPLLVFVAVWGTAASLLGLVAYAARAERLTAGLILALGVGGWSYLVTGISLLIMRQVPAHQAFHAAATERAIYIPAAL